MPDELEAHMAFCNGMKNSARFLDAPEGKSTYLAS